MTNPADIDRLETPDGQSIAYVKTEGRAGKAQLVWLGGFKSDMDGTKAVALEAWAKETGRSFLRFDYFGHGSSSGDFEDGTIGRWKDDALYVLDQLTQGPQILIGSSMGGWISLLVAKARAERLAGILLIAPAPDFTHELMWPNFPDHIRKTIEEEGKFVDPSEDPDDPYIVTHKLIADGPNWSVLGEPIAFEGPVRILQGQRDASVPPTHAQRCVDILTSEDIVFTLVKAGDHRLSTEADLIRLKASAEELARYVEAKA